MPYLLSAFFGLLYFLPQPAMSKDLVLHFAGIPQTQTIGYFFYLLIPVISSGLVLAFERFPGDAKTKHTVKWFTITLLACLAVRSQFTDTPVMEATVPGILFYFTGKFFPILFLLSFSFNFVLSSYPQFDHKARTFFLVNFAGSLLGLFFYPFILETMISDPTFLGVHFALASALLIASSVYQFRIPIPTIKGWNFSGEKLPFVLIGALIAIGTGIFMKYIHAEGGTPIYAIFLTALALFNTAISIYFPISRKWVQILAGLCFIASAGLIVMALIQEDVFFLKVTPLLIIINFWQFVLVHAFMLRTKESSTISSYFFLNLGTLIGILILIFFIPAFISFTEEGKFLITLLVVTSCELAIRGKASAYAPICLLIGFSFMKNSNADIVFEHNSFTGNVLVSRIKNKPHKRDIKVLWHNKIVYGFQFDDPVLKDSPMGYFFPQSTIGKTITTLQSKSPSISVKAIGMGIGAVSAYARPHDRFTFYEISPVVIDVAKKYFDYVIGPQRNIQIVQDDGRAALEKEIAIGQTGDADVLFLDAYHGTSNPFHLITIEAYEVYLKKLSEKGIIVMTIGLEASRFLPILASHIKTLGIHGYWNDGATKNQRIHPTSAMFTRNPLTQEEMKAMEVLPIPMDKFESAVSDTNFGYYRFYQFDLGIAYFWKGYGIFNEWLENYQ